MTETGWIYRKYQGSNTGLSDYAVDYVFNGAEVIYSAVVEPGRYKVDAQGNTYDACKGFSVIFATCPAEQEWFAKHSQVWANAVNQGAILQHTESPDNGNFAFKLRSVMDRNSINDIKGDMDNYVRGAGFSLKASQAYFISNPRRDGATQPVVNTPGVNPQYTLKPPQSLIDTFHAADTLLGNAASAWGLNGPQGKLLLGIGIIAAAAFLLRR